MSLKIPDGSRLRRTGARKGNADGGLRYRPAPLGEFALRNMLDPERVGDEDFACELIARWYLADRESGGKADPAIEGILSRHATP